MIKLSLKLGDVLFLIPRLPGKIQAAKTQYITTMKLQTLVTLICALVISPVITTPLMGQDSTKGSSKAEPKAKGNTYPLYGKVVAVTSRTLTIVRSESEDAKQSKYTLNAATQYVNGEKSATLEDVKVGSWVGGTLQKSVGEGNDVVLKLNVGAKQREAKAKKKAEAPKKAETPKKASAKEAAKKKES